MTKHLVYKTTNLVNGKFYIGVHSCNCKSCSYLGSGFALKAAIRKYGKDNFKRETLKVFSTRQEAYNFEAKLVDKEDPLSYNLIKGGSGFHRQTRSYIVNGKDYGSLKAACKHFGLTPAGLRYRKLNPARVSKSCQNRLNRSKPCTIKDKDYSSQSEAAKDLGVSNATISNWLKALPSTC